jgi:hypothetical protein
MLILLKLLIMSRPRFRTRKESTKIDLCRKAIGRWKNFGGLEYSERVYLALGVEIERRNNANLRQNFDCKNHHSRC